MPSDKYRRAVEQAAHIFADLRPDFGGTLAEDALTVFQRRPDRFTRKLPDLILHSREHRAAWDMLNLMAQHELRRGAPIPPMLAAWIADVLADVLAGDAPRPVKDGCAKDGRDAAMQATVAALVLAFDLTATRNDSSPEESACDAVAEAFGETYRAAKKAWLSKENPYREGPEAIFDVAAGRVPENRKIKDMSR